MGKSRPSDETCQELLEPGKPEAEGLVERLAHCLSKDMQRYALRRCGNLEDAEDAVQEAMTVAIRYIDGFRGESSLRSWMLRLVSTACTRQRRGRRNDPSIHSSIDEHPENWNQRLPDPQLLPEEKLIVEERLGRVAQVVSELPEHERNLLLEHEGEGVPLAAIAQSSGQTVAAVRSKLYRVRQRLRSDLEDLLNPEDDEEAAS